MSKFKLIEFKNIDVEISKLKVKEDDILIIRSETITPRMVEAFQNYCVENQIKNNTVFLHKTMDMDAISLENLINQLTEKLNQKKISEDKTKLLPFDNEEKKA